MTRKLLLIVFALSLSAITGVAADVAGRWSITITTAEGPSTGLGR